MATPVKPFLFLGGASIAALGVAYVGGAFDAPPQPPSAIAQPATPPAATAPEVKAEAPAVTEPAKQAAAEQPAADPAKPAEQQVAAAQPEAPAAAESPTPVPPAFDLLRVEPDGSMVIAGRAMAGSTVEAMAGSRLLGKAQAAPEGDFVIVLDEPLKPGDYQVVLRSTGPGSIVVNSVETAVVSVPETAAGQVLALVQQPGAPSKLITVTPEEPAAAVDAAAQPAAPATTAEKPATAATVTVEAVEIDGRKVFVAGAAPAGSTVRAYANEILLGDAKASPDGNFLIEAERELPVGDYIVRVDQLSSDGKVVARAAVPFKREAGETIAAVAPAKPVQPADAKPAEEPAAAATTEPAATDVAAAPAADGAQVETTTAPQLQSSTSGVIIRRGDTLWRISKRVYGHGVRFSTIYTANRTQITDPNRIWPGQVFKVPDTSEEGETADMKAVGDQATTVE